MHKKNLTPQTIQPVNRITIQELPTQFVELSDKELQQIVGGSEPSNTPPVGTKKQD
jgi:bacteriocin leader peptide (microcyclamide/patellamide family)